MPYFETPLPTDLASVVALTEDIFGQATVTLEGTRYDGPGQAALNGLAYAVDALRKAHQAVLASGEGGI